MKCKEFGKAYGVTPMQVGRIRKKFYPGHNGGELSEDEIAMLTSYFDNLLDLQVRKELEEVVKPQFVDGIISYIRVGQARAEVFLKGKGERVLAHLAYRATNDMLRKPIKLEVIEYEGKKYYRDARLAGRAWQN